MSSRSEAGSARERRAPGWLRLVNPINRFMLRRGLGPAAQHLLSVPGRKTGQTRTTHVAIVNVGGERYVVPGFDGSDWVKNARAAGRGSLQRGQDVEYVLLREVLVHERGPILQIFARQVRGGRAFLTVPADATPDAFADAAARHPVFHISRVESAQAG
jgi:deazaflavin-dependent oxidoreductase (nitroreductase family)